MMTVKPPGMQHAAAALRNLERKQEIIANNLANVSTTGFKQELTFAQLLDGASAPSVGSVTDMRTGAMTHTGQPLDLAIERDGFLVAETAAGERWTRGGTLSIDDRRLLVDSVGNPLLGEFDPRGGEPGPVTIPATARDVRIDREGSVIVDGDQIARLRVERPAGRDPNARLERLGDGYFRPGVPERMEPGQRTLRQGALEESNVGSLDSMVELIAVQRAYGGVQKVLTTIDSVCHIAVTQLGRPA